MCNYETTSADKKGKAVPVLNQESHQWRVFN